MTESNVPPPPPAADTDAPVVGYQATAGADIVPPQSKDDQNMGLLMFILGIFTHFIGPLILWLMKKDQSRYIDAQGKEIINFQITVFLTAIAVMIIAIVTLGIGALLFPVLGITYLVFMIIGAVTASKGNFYRFPLALRLLK
jgi:uncharacterized Tic20 family protein